MSQHGLFSRRYDVGPAGAAGCCPNAPPPRCRCRPRVFFTCGDAVRRGWRTESRGRIDACSGVGVVAVKRLVLEQRLRERVEPVAVLALPGVSRKKWSTRGQKPSKIVRCVALDAKLSRSARVIVGERFE